MSITIDKEERPCTGGLFRNREHQRCSESWSDQHVWCSGCLATWLRRELDAAETLLREEAGPVSGDDPG